MCFYTQTHCHTRRHRCRMPLIVLALFTRLGLHTSGEVRKQVFLDECSFFPSPPSLKQAYIQSSEIPKKLSGKKREERHKEMGRKKGKKVGMKCERKGYEEERIKDQRGINGLGLKQEWEIFHAYDILLHKNVCKRYWAQWIIIRLASKIRKFMFG